MIGFLWSIENKGDINALPSMNEIFYGLFQFISSFLTMKLEANNQKKIWIQTCINCYREIFDYILEKTDYVEEGQVPIKLADLKNPYSKAVCLIMYMYGMESPLFMELNNSWKNPDRNKIEFFGPIERALYEILKTAEKYRHDRLDSSSIVCLPQCFLVYKGASMTKSEINDWKKNVGGRAIIPGNTCFTHQLR